MAIHFEDLLVNVDGRESSNKFKLRRFLKFNKKRKKDKDEEREILIDPFLIEEIVDILIILSI